MQISALEESIECLNQNMLPIVFERFRTMAGCTREKLIETLAIQDEAMGLLPKEYGQSMRCDYSLYVRRSNAKNQRKSENKIHESTEAFNRTR